MRLNTVYILLTAIFSFNLVYSLLEFTNFDVSLILSNQEIVAPLVFTDPAFPNQFDDITLFFDPSEGNGALENFDGKVYAHMGLITENSIGPSDWKYVIGNWGTADSRTLMEKDSNGLYFLKYNIAVHHGLPIDEVVKQLAFVFRNVDGSIVGRDSDGSDIYLDVFPKEQGLNIVINSPDLTGEILNLGDSLTINAQLSQTAYLEIKDNDQTIYQDSTDKVDFRIEPVGLGNHILEFRVSSMDTVIIEAAKYLLLDSVEMLLDPPASLINGVNYTSDSTIALLLTAPGKDNVFLLTDFNKYKPDANFRLKKSINKEKFWIELDKRQFGKNQLTYQYLVDGSLRIADPFSKVILDPSNDFEIDDRVLDELPEYPLDYTSGRVSIVDLHPTIFVFDQFEKPNKENLVIYEILLRDFLADHSFVSLTDTLKYLSKLGVNAIELMPINEFEGNQSWGYNPSFHMAVDKYYGSILELKQLINTAHELGMAVILDVVFNHAFSQSPLAQLYWEPSKFRPSVESPYLNPVPKHPFNVGYDFNHESKYTKEWVKQILGYWIDEFHFDGFRFDLSKGLTQKNSGDNAQLMANYDPSRISILKEYSDHIWEIDSSAYVIMEHFAENREEKEMAEYGMMLWGNMNHSFTELAKGFNQDLAWSDYTQRGWTQPNLISYIESHDEERIMYKILNEGSGQGDYNTRELTTALRRVGAASVIYFTTPGPKMMWQFGELGYDFSINSCINGQVNGCRLDPKPVRWDYIENKDRKELYLFISNLIYLRNSFATFTTSEFTFLDKNLFKAVQLKHTEMDAVTMANFRVTTSEEQLGFPYSGTWYEYFSGDSLVVEDVNVSLNFLPGEYRIYLSKRITPPNGFTTNVSLNKDVTSVTVYPNPITANRIQLNLSKNYKVKMSNILNSDGKRIKHYVEQLEDRLQITLIDYLAPGVYFIELITGEGRYVSKFVR